MAILNDDIQKAQVLFNPNGFWIEHGASNNKKKPIVDASHSEDDSIRQVTSAYIDNIYINESIVSMVCVQHVGLICK